MFTKKHHQIDQGDDDTSTKEPIGRRPSGLGANWATRGITFGSALALLLVFGLILNRYNVALLDTSAATGELTPTPILSGAEFGNPPVVTLDRYSVAVTELHPGDMLQLSVWWLYPEPSAADKYIVSVQLVDAAGVTVADINLRPLVENGNYQLKISSETEAGSYRLQVSVSQKDTGETLPVMAGGEPIGSVLTLDVPISISEDEATDVPASEGPPLTDEHPAVTNTPPPTLTPTPTAAPSVTPVPSSTATPTRAADECLLALDLSVPPSYFVSAYPDPNNRDIVAQVEAGVWYKATGQYQHANGTTWYRIEVNGLVGWVLSFYYQFDGQGTDACSNLEVVAVDVPPTPTITPGATPPIPPGIEYDSVIYVNHNVPTAQVSVTLSSGSRPTHAFGVRVNDVPVGQWRNLDVWVTCEGDTQYLDVWGTYGETLESECGTTYSTNGVTLTHNFYAFQLALPANVPMLTFAINVRLY